MLPLLIIVGLVTAASVVVVASGPSTSRTRDTDSARRARYLSRNPHVVNSGDIHRMLAESGLEIDQIARTTNGAVEMGYSSFTMFAWIKRYDARTLCEVIAERVSEHEALAHLSNGTLPQIDAISFFASSQDVPMQVRADRDERRRRQASPRTLNAAAHRTPSISVPTVFAPGDWTMEAGRTAVLVDEPATLDLLDEMFDEILDQEYPTEGRPVVRQAA